MVWFGLPIAFGFRQPHMPALMCRKIKMEGEKDRMPQFFVTLFLLSCVGYTAGAIGNGRGNGVINLDQ